MDIVQAMLAGALILLIGIVGGYAAARKHGRELWLARDGVSLYKTGGTGEAVESK